MQKSDRPDLPCMPLYHHHRTHRHTHTHTHLASGTRASHAHRPKWKAALSRSPCLHTAPPWPEGIRLTAASSGRCCAWDIKKRVHKVDIRERLHAPRGELEKLGRRSSLWLLVASSHATKGCAVGLVTSRIVARPAQSRHDATGATGACCGAALAVGSAQRTLATARRVADAARRG